MKSKVFGIFVIVIELRDQAQPSIYLVMSKELEVITQQ